MPYVAEYSEIFSPLTAPSAVHFRKLNLNFLNKLLPACFSPPRLAVRALLIFISASSVYYLIAEIIKKFFLFVKQTS
jgi:hypothetical protein